MPFALGGSVCLISQGLCSQADTCVWVWFVASVVKSFEKNDFFDEGISKAQLFLSLHDAVLFALSRKFSEPSDLSMDETETVIQETYSESDKVG